MDETIFVLGLGETLKYFRHFDRPSIGVNDIWKHIPTKQIMCLDAKDRFSPERLKTIRTSWPDVFYSHLKEWEPHFKSHFNHLPLNMGHDKAGKEFIFGKVFYSNNTPFTACSLASTQGFKNIVVFGADFNTHPLIKGPVIVGETIKHYKWLHENLKGHGVNLYVGHRQSKLSQVLPVYNDL